MRSGTTDWLVYRQIFEELEYQCLPSNFNPETILDLGANVGYSSAYFLTRYPDAKVIAIEPDGDNFAALCENLKPYGNRASALHAAVWSKQDFLSLRTDHYRGGGAWAKQVRVDAEGSIAAFDIEALMRRFALPEISLVKMDIEGAEVEVFKGSLNWIDNIEVLVVELHDDSAFGSASRVVVPEMQRRGFESWTHGELTVFRRPQSV